MLQIPDDHTLLPKMEAIHRLLLQAIEPLVEELPSNQRENGAQMLM